MASTHHTQMASENARNGVDMRNKDLTVASNEKEELASCEDCGEYAGEFECDGYFRCEYCHDYYICAMIDAYVEEQEDDFQAEEEQEEDDYEQDDIFAEALEEMKIDGSYALLTGGRLH